MLVQIHGIDQHPDVRHVNQLRGSRLLYLSIMMTDDGGTWLEVGDGGTWWNLVARSSWYVYTHSQLSVGHTVNRSYGCLHRFKRLKVASHDTTQ